MTNITEQDFNQEEFQRMLREAIDNAIKPLQEKLNQVRQMQDGTYKPAPKEPDVDPNKTPEELNNERMLKEIDAQIKALDEAEKKAESEVDLTGKDRDEVMKKVGANMERRAKYEQERQKLISLRNKTEKPTQAVQDYIEERKNDTEENWQSAINETTNYRKNKVEEASQGKAII